jgi:hypothetical protein
VARKLSNPSWKVIVSASRGQYLKPGSFEPGFFCRGTLCSANTFIMRSVGDDIVGFMHAAAPIPLTGLAAPIIIRR